MKKNKDETEKGETLRKRAEMRLREDMPDLKELPISDIQRLIHELQVYQIELEMQNEELRRVQQQLEESREKYINLYEFAPMGYFSLNREGMIQQANLTGAQLLGRERRSLIKRPFLTFVSQDTRDTFYLHVRKVFNIKTRQTCKIILVRKDGSQFPAKLESILMMDSSDKHTHFRMAVSDISERMQAENALADEKERLAVTLRSIGDGVIATDLEGKIVLMNKIVEKLTGWSNEETIDKPLDKIFHIINEKTRERCEDPVEKVLKTGAVVGLANDTVLVARDGTERIIADSGAPIRDKNGNIIGVVLVFRDITEERRMERELQKIEKLESLGILAGGIAHDFNNILTAAIGNISLTKMRTLPDDKVVERLSAAEKALMRAKDLTQQLLTFSKGGEPIKKPSSISDLLKETANFALSGSNVMCEYSIPEDLWSVDIDVGQISQVINNLIINADQAMPEGGIIKVNAENVIVEADNSLSLQEGHYVKIVIEDQGVGIPKEQRSKIFDPYFTTKQTTSGLGLTIAYSIVKNHEGYIGVESVVDRGTTFYIYLPTSQKQIVEEEVMDTKKFVDKGKILVMDDEQSIRDALEEILTYLGYKAEFARDGEEAITQYKTAKDSGQPFDAVILDLTIKGGMGGKETIKKLVAFDPEVKAVVSSGYSQDPIMADFRKYGFSGVIAKPYNIEELSVALQKIITNE